MCLNQVDFYEIFLISAEIRLISVEFAKIGSISPASEFKGITPAVSTVNVRVRRDLSAVGKSAEKSQHGNAERQSIQTGDVLSNGIPVGLPQISLQGGFRHERYLQAGGGSQRRPRPSLLPGTWGTTATDLLLTFSVTQP